MLRYHHEMILAMPLKAGRMPFCHSHLAALPMFAKAALIHGHAVFRNHATVAAAARLIPAHAASTIRRKVSLFLYARTIPAPRAMSAVMTSPMGFIRRTALNARWARTSALVAIVLTFMAKARAFSATVCRIVDKVAKFVARR